MNPTRLLPALIAGCLLNGAPAAAAVFKCPGENGTTTYQSMPCGTPAPSEPLLGQSVDSGPAEGQADGRGLWEITTTLRPRVPARGEVARTRLSIGDPGAEERAAVSAPAKQLSCADKSPLKAWFSPLVMQRCRTQIAAQGGPCLVQDDKSDGRGAEIKEVLMLEGNYRTELHVVSRLSTSSVAEPEPVTDEARIDLRYIGDCKPGMAPGDTFQAGPNGNWVKVR